MKTVDFSETIEACDLKVGRNRQLIAFISQDYSRYRLFWKYAEIGYFGRLKLFPFHGLTRVHFSLFSENNGLLNIFMLK